MLEKIFPIDNIFFVFFIAILTIWLTLVTSGLIDARYSSWKNRLKKKGRSALKIGGAIALLLTMQEVNNRAISNKKDNQLHNEQKSRDSVISEGVKKATDKLFQDLSLAFKKQGLQYDSIKKQIFYIKDSIRTNNASIIPPLLRIRNLEFKDSSAITRRNTILYEIISDNAVSYNCDLKFDVFGFTTNVTPTSIDFNLRAFYKNITIAKDQRLSAYLSFIDNFHCNTYVLRLKGSYYSSDKKLKTIDDLYLLRNNGEKFIFELPSEFHDKVFRDYIRENKF
ncbi:hypothetical protein [Flavobacterium tistrianum]|uniref:hypothetical protein n=1 Tax=Flavobacterium tistrianum TaxID=1685414 RepID=UPI000DAE0E4F|nr:hypothetical protein [Flavobacterium tistrianum]KAF2342907.1 hypothetical protein DMB71_01540 [Flavobacterium tistrianum]